MSYIEGIVCAVPTANKQKFIEHAKLADSVFMELGALRILECWGDDVPEGKLTDFRRAVQAKNDETVVFSWIEWPDKATRDAAAAKMPELMKADDRFRPETNPMPFDGARLIFGGFSPVVALEKTASGISSVVTPEGPPSNKPGDFIWYELLTTDVEAAQKFYAAILGWRYADSGQTAMDYRIIHAGENGVGGIMALTKEMCTNGAKPTWLGYIAVEDVDKTVADIQKRGGSVPMAAMDIPNVGRIAMVADPYGAPFYVMKPSSSGVSHAFSCENARPGHCAWNELHTPNQPGAWTFYGELFGWRREGEMDMGPMGKYQFIQHGTMLGAMMPNAAAGTQPRWNQYFQVQDIDAAKAAVQAGGGKVTQGPDEIPGGQFAMNCIDPQGAAFGLVGPRQR